MLHLMQLKWAALLASLGALTSLLKAQVHTQTFKPGKETNLDDLVKVFPTPHSNVNEPKGNSPFIVVSTLDGKISALDTKHGGKLLWTMDIGSGPLVSSSISKLQINQDGKTIRLIPSLSGGLFKFDGNSVEALPFSAEQLLSSSFKVSDDSILVGGKEVTTFGLDSSNGNIVYLCSAYGCETFHEVSPTTDVIIVKRSQQTVRSVENRHGRENWNFTVGEVELEVSRGKTYQLLEHSGDEGSSTEQGSTTMHHHHQDNSHSEGNPDASTDPRSSSIFSKLNVLVPEGTIYKFNDENKPSLDWKHKFDSPIANAWYVNGGNYQKLDLFDPETVPALRDRNNGRSNGDPTIYMGFYGSHVYIQVSSTTRKAITNSMMPSPRSHVRPRSRSPFNQVVKFPYRPFTASSDHLKRAVVGESKEGEIQVYQKSNAKGSCGNNLAIYRDNTNGEDVGYYFKSDIPYFISISESGKKGRTTELDDGNESYGNSNIDVVYSSFMHWWKEILFISVTTSIFMQLFIVKIMQLSKSKDENILKSSSGSYADALSDIQPQMVNASTSFQSRYLNDFEPIQCLGKGGFGVVFESRNKVDHCSYAIKRIRLPNKQSARDKVMREVRALAKLEHSGIVRYFNAWTEEPPQGWQEKADRELLSDISTYASSASFLAQSTTHPPPSYSKLQTDIGNTGAFTPSHSVGVSEGFSEETRSFSLHSDKFNKSGEASVFSDIVPTKAGKFFQSANTDSSDSGDETGSPSIQLVPFGRYKDESLSIVFEKSAQKPMGSTGDSAIEEDAFSSPIANKKGHVRNISNVGELPQYKDIYKDFTSTPGSKLRKRSSSQKLQMPEDSDTGSELNAVICRDETDKKKAEDEKIKPKVAVSVYLYIQMQLCQKDSLRKWLADNHTREDGYCLWIFHQVLNAVQYVHDCNLIHRDLKPSNVFFSFDGGIKVGDFGLVTESDELSGDMLNESTIHNDNDYLSDGSHTERVGTRLYMAPEQMSGPKYSQKVDIFALGLILIELFTPFSTQMERIRELTKARDGKIDKKFAREYHHEATLARQMLCQNPSQRPTAVEAIKHDVFNNKDLSQYQVKRTRTSSN
ncbi:eukaryotic translation initiation factor 2-alpha kinase 3-like [Styela clava]